MDTRHHDLAILGTAVLMDIQFVLMFRNMSSHKLFYPTLKVKAIWCSSGKSLLPVQI